MFAAHCPREQKDVLLGFRSIEGIRNTPEAIEITFMCTCGHRGVWSTGRHQRFRTTPTTIEGL